MSFNNGQWHCQQCNRNIGAHQLITDAIKVRSVVFESAGVTLWSSESAVQQTLHSPAAEVLPSSSNQILECQSISEIVQMLQAMYNGLFIPPDRVNNALVLAQLQFLRLTNLSNLLSLSYEERQLNLMLLVAYWIVRKDPGYQEEAPLFLEQTQVMFTSLEQGLGFLQQAQDGNSTELLALFYNHETARYSMRRALAGLRELQTGYPGIFQFGQQRGLVIIYFFNGVYHLITPFNRVVRVSRPEQLVRILVDLLRHRTIRQWLPDYVAKVVVAYTIGAMVGGVLGVPAAVAGNLSGRLGSQDMLTVISGYSVFVGTVFALARIGLYETEPELNIDEDLD